MRVVIAPDKFKGCLSARQVAEAIGQGLRRAQPDVELDLCPMADGGEGTVEAMVAATGGRLITHRVTGPLPEMKVDAPFGMLGDGQTAVVEMAAASGLHLLHPQQRNPMNTTTFGTGELLMAAAELGAKRIILGIGGSATTDGGLGCAQACGGIPILEGDSPLDRPIVGREMARVLRLTWDDRFTRYGVTITVASDVINPLTGPNGAAHVYGPQKGASPQDVQQLDAALARLARILHAEEKAAAPGAGAAGGLGFGMMVFFGARLRSGIDLVIDAVRLRDRLAKADLCITGEGRFDSQSLSGKTPVGVARICREMQVPCALIAGDIEKATRVAGKELFTHSVAIRNISNAGEDSYRDAAKLLSRAAREIYHSGPNAT